MHRAELDLEVPESSLYASRPFRHRPAACEEPALRALTPTHPLLVLSSLPHERRVRLKNAMAWASKAGRGLDPAFPIRVGGLGRGPHAHLLSRVDLRPWALAALVEGVRDVLHAWVNADASAVARESTVEDLRPYLPLRRAWTFSRVLLHLLPAIEHLGDDLHRWPSVLPVAQRLLERIAARYEAVAGTPVRRFESAETCPAVSKTVGPRELGRLVATGSGSLTALGSDLSRTPVMEAGLRPAFTRTASMEMVVRWRSSQESLARVAARFVQESGAPYGCTVTTPQVAVARAREDAWAVAALACWPSADGLGAAEAATRRARLEPLARWSIRQIEAALTPGRGHTDGTHRAPEGVTLHPACELVEVALSEAQRVLRRPRQRAS